MSSQVKDYSELTELLELQFEDRISASEFRRLEQIIRGDADSRRFYLQYVDLHGALYYDTASTEPKSFVTPGKSSRVVATHSEADERLLSSLDRPRGSHRFVAIVASVCCLVLVVGVVWKNYSRNEERIASHIDKTNSSANGPSANDARDGANGVAPRNVDTVKNKLPGPKIGVAGTTSHRPDEDNRSTSPNSDVSNAVVVGQQNANAVRNLGSDEAVVGFINEQLLKGWQDNEITASARASDAEWIRRVFLDIVGHIPTVEQTAKFLANTKADKRTRVIEVLLKDEDYVRHSTTIWTNLLIGRSNPRQVNRGALEKYFREAFALNRGWDEVVADIISAEGSADENGASNFLLAHLNDQAVPATAITSKLFLGLQLQCTQCHNHPFNDSTQAEFWEFNSFFKQIEVANRTSKSNPNERVALLRNNGAGGPTFYESRQGVVAAALPRFNGVQVSADASVNRRAELAKILTTGDSTQIARAFVNRLWKQYFGASFTPAVDDMGSHVEVSHPELLDQLTREFVRSGYDIKRLTRWICQSNAYNLSSQASENNPVDNPQIGNTPLFSRAYVKSMNVEQLFDSVLVATQAQDAFGSSWDVVQQRRQQWLQQFVQAWDTDENDEADLFDGSISQALMMMNGELVSLALSNRGTLLNDIVLDRTSDTAKIEAISLAALSRKPSTQETAAVRRLIRDRAPHMDARSATASSLQDLFWAYLNSNEFILIH